MIPAKILMIAEPSNTNAPINKPHVKSIVPNPLIVVEYVPWKGCVDIAVIMAVASGGSGIPNIDPKDETKVPNRLIKMIMIITKIRKLNPPKINLLPIDFARFAPIISTKVRIIPVIKTI